VRVNERTKELALASEQAKNFSMTLAATRWPAGGGLASS